MTQDDIISRIRADADRTDKAIARHEAEIARLIGERDELQVTLRTLGRLGVLEKGNASAPVGPKMTVPEMVLEVLSRPENVQGARPDPVLTAIRESYDPNIDPNNVRPTMWRMAKDGRLEKNGELYRLPQTNEAPDNNPDHGSSGASVPAEESREGIFG